MIEGLPSGMHVIDSACGAGKTTQIKGFILKHYDEGIVYCVDSIAELHNMKEWLYMQLVMPGKIVPDDIIMITSENDDDAKQARNSYCANPDILCWKKILLLTHVRFFSSMINYFLIYRPQFQVSPFDGDFQGLLSRPDLRQWIFFDETPMWIRPFCTMPRSFLGLWSTKDINGNWQCKSPQDIDESYRVFIQNSKQDPFQHNNRLDLLKKESVLSMVPKMYPVWRAESKDQDISITFRPRDLVQPNTQTRIVVFEGAADLLLHGGPFNLLNNQGRKYNATVNFYPIPTPTERNANFNWEAYLNGLSQVVVPIICRNISQGGKMLVCVWKTENSSQADSEESNQSRFRDDVRDYLYQLIGCGPGWFDVIYYGENKCKSCNDFREYSDIILYGKWSLPSNKHIEHNLNWGTRISRRDMDMWFFVQLICRIGIRNHQDGVFNVYYTDDYSQKFIECLDSYFSTGQTPIQAIPQPSIKDILLGVHIKKQPRDYIEELCNRDPALRDHIQNQGTTNRYTLAIPDAELREIIQPTKDCNYNRSVGRLTEALEKVNVDLDVI